MTFSTIGDHVELQRGTTYKSALLNQPGPFLLGLGSIARDGGFRPEKLKTYGGPSAEKILVYPGDLYVSLKDVTQSGDLLGSIARVPEDIAVGRMTQDTVKLCFKTDIPKSYFYWLLRTPQYRLHCRAHATGTTNLGLSRDDFFSFEIPELSAERERLTALLENLESKIDLFNRTNQTLEQIAQAIFKSWFVDFEPTRAKIAAKQNGQDPERTAMAAISGKSLEELDQLSPEQLQQLKATAALFPDALVDSELGAIPEGWEASTLGEHFNVVMGQSPKGDTYNEEGEGMLFFQGRRDFGFRYPTPRVYTTAPKRLAQAGDTLISVRAPVGDRNMANQECCLGRGVASIRHKSGARSFTYAFIGHIENTLSDSGSDGTVFSSINKKELGAINVVAPNEKLLSYFEVTADPIDEKIEVNSKEISSLEKLRDTLLPKLLSGECTQA